MNSPSMSDRIGNTKDPLLAQGFRDVDATSQDGYARCVHCLDTIRALPQFQKSREIGFKALSLTASPPLCVLDIGCGLGHDTRYFAETIYNNGARFPESSVIGLDKSGEFLSDALIRSQQIINEKPNYPLNFMQGDITDLGNIKLLKNIDRIWEERTLQHIPLNQFVSTLTGIYNALSPGGIFVSVEPNWELFLIASSDLSISRKFTHFWADSFNHGQIANNLLLELPKIGFTDVSTEACEIHFRKFEEADIVFDITRSIEKLITTGVIPSESGTAWLKEQKMRGDDFLCTLSMWITKASRS